MKVPKQSDKKHKLVGSQSKKFNLIKPACLGQSELYQLQEHSLARNVIFQVEEYFNAFRHTNQKESGGGEKQFNTSFPSRYGAESSCLSEELQ